MKNNNKLDKITVSFTSGRMHALTFYAGSEEEAKKLAFAEYRRNLTGMDFSKIDDVIAGVKIDPKAKVNYTYSPAVVIEKYCLKSILSKKM